MQGDSHVRGAALDTPASRGNHRRSTGAERCAPAPADDRRWDPLAPRVHENGIIVLTELQPSRRYRAIAGRTRQPRRRHEADRRQSQHPERRKASVDPLAGGRLIQRQKLCLARGLPPCTPAITPPSRQPLLIVALTMEKNLGAFSSPRDDPFYKRRMPVQWPPAMPVWDD